jgi:hypothetical protein
VLDLFPFLVEFRFSRYQNSALWNICDKVPKKLSFASFRAREAIRAFSFGEFTQQLKIPLAPITSKIGIYYLICGESLTARQPIFCSPQQMQEKWTCEKL